MIARVGTLTVTAAVIALGLGACGGDDDGEADRATGPQAGFVGAAGDLSVGVVAGDGGAVVAFVADGEEVSEWFTGEVQGESIELTSKRGARLTAELGADAVTGTVSLSSPQPTAAPGETARLASHEARERERRLAQATTTEFRLDPATAELAGVWRATKQVGGEEVLAGWVSEAGGGLGTEAIVGNVEMMQRPEVEPSGLVPFELETKIAEVGTYADLDVGDVTAHRIVAGAPAEGEVDVDDADFGPGSSDFVPR